jgi:hypothetical protein
MTPEKHDPWALLREAKRLIAANRLMLGHYSGVREIGSLEDRIDAALAERQDSATDVVEWEVCGSGFSIYIASMDDDTTLDAIRLNSGDWRWSAEVDRRKCGTCATEAEAKSAAIAAARGMR